MRPFAFLLVGAIVTTTSTIAFANANAKHTTRAQTRSTTVVAMLPRDEVEQLLPDRRLQLKPIAGAPRNLHPVLIDLTRIGRGEAIVGGRPARDYSLLAGVFAPLVSAAMDAAGDHAGHYNELIAAVPVHVGAKQYLYVPGMYLDGKIGHRLEQAFEFGYRKELVRIEQAPFVSFDVSGNGENLVSAQLKQLKSFRDARQVAELERMTPLVSLPLLGHLGGTRYALSHLYRNFHPAESHVIAAPAVANLDVRERSFLAPLRSLDGKTEYPAVMLDGAHTYLDLPRHVTVANLSE